MSLQEKAETLGIFDDDETELSKTVKYQTQKLFVCIQDLLKQAAGRTEMEWPDLLAKVVQYAKGISANTKSAGKKKVKK
jgi:hypothetical protein